jgi:hypothetical protein
MKKSLNDLGSGFQYVGELKAGKRDGKGTLYGVSGTISTEDNILPLSVLHALYEGDWKEDKQDGWGVCYYEDGSRYEGNWKDGKRYGEGAHYYTDGSRYVGSWEDDKKNGKGTYYNPDKSVCTAPQIFNTFSLSKLM